MIVGKGQSLAWKITRIIVLGGPMFAPFVKKVLRTKICYSITKFTTQTRENLDAINVENGSMLVPISKFITAFTQERKTSTAMIVEKASWVQVN